MIKAAIFDNGGVLCGDVRNFYVRDEFGKQEELHQKILPLHLGNVGSHMVMSYLLRHLITKREKRTIFITV